MARPRLHGPAALLLAGSALAAVGLATEPQDGDGKTTAFPTSSGWGTSDSNDGMIAVTGMDVTGASILYLVDTKNRQLAVYQANGGSDSTMGLKFVAGRRIDLDLQVWGYNDKSRYSYGDMIKKFEREESGPNR